MDFAANYRTVTIRLHRILSATRLLFYVVGCAVLYLFGTSAHSSERSRTIKVLLDEAKVYSILKVSATGADGTATAINLSDCPKFDDQIFVGAYRFEIELAMLCAAMRDDGMAERFEFVPYPNLKRAVAELESGRAALIGDTAFRSEMGDNVLQSEAMLRRDEFQVAVFTTPNRIDVRSISTPSELRRLNAITVKYWEVDKRTLSSMGLRSVVTTRKMSQIPAMIERGRADFTLSYLDRPTIEHMGAPLVRVDGFRVSYAGERVFALSKSNPVLHAALSAFIKKNRAAKPDRIREAYKRVGFISDKYDHWQDVTGDR